MADTAVFDSRIALPEQSAGLAEVVPMPFLKDEAAYGTEEQATPLDELPARPYNTRDLLVEIATSGAEPVTGASVFLHPDESAKTHVEHELEGFMPDQPPTIEKTGRLRSIARKVGLAAVKPVVQLQNKVREVAVKKYERHQQAKYMLDAERRGRRWDRIETIGPVVGYVALAAGATLVAYAVHKGYISLPGKSGASQGSLGSDAAEHLPRGTGGGHSNQHNPYDFLQGLGSRGSSDQLKEQQFLDQLRANSPFSQGTAADNEWVARAIENLGSA